MNRIWSGLAVFLMLFIAYQFSQVRISPAIDLTVKPSVKPTVAQSVRQNIPVEVAAVKWPSEPEKGPEIIKPKKPVPAKKKQPVKNSKKFETEKSGNAGKSGAGFDVVGQFECPVDFYLSAMRRQGALVVAYENQRKQFIAISPQGDLTLLERFPAGYSPLTRRISDDYPDAQKVLSLAAQRWGRGVYDILLVLPQSLELQIEQKLKQILAGRVSVKDVTKVYVRYRRSGAQLVMHVEQVRIHSDSFPIEQNIEI